MIIEKFSCEQWKELSEQAHLICFNEIRPASVDRIDFALMAVDENKIPLSYMTIREVDSETAYLQYGGSFKPGSVHSFRSYELMLNRLKEEGYLRLQTYIENTNTTMLKFALKAGWLITGIRTFEGSILTEQTMKFGEKK